MRLFSPLSLTISLMIAGSTLKQSYGMIKENVKPAFMAVVKDLKEFA
jgi:hypothetical protein